MSQILEEKSLSELRDIADSYGIEYPRNIGKTKIIEKIIADDEAVDAKPAKAEDDIEGVKPRKKETVGEMKKRMNKLIRVRISATDPQWKNRTFISKQVGNGAVMVGKHIPFDVIWHGQEPVIKSIERQTYRETVFKTDRVSGMKVPVVKVKKSFVVERLPQLTEKQIEKLAAEQAARGSIDEKVGLDLN